MTTNELLTKMYARNNEYSHFEEKQCSQSVQGEEVTKCFFSCFRTPTMLFGKTYYMEYHNALCQVRLNKIVYSNFDKIGYTLLDVAYDGQIVQYKWDDKSNPIVTMPNIYESVAAFKNKTPMPIQRYNNLITIFGILTYNHFNGYYDYKYFSNTQTNLKYNFLECYKWDGAKVVSAMPKSLNYMGKCLEITEKGVYVGNDRKEFEMLYLADLIGIDTDELYNRAKDCEEENEIQIFTFPKEEDTHEEDNNTIEVTISCNTIAIQSLKDLLNGLGATIIC